MGFQVVVVIRVVGGESMRKEIQQGTQNIGFTQCGDLCLATELFFDGCDYYGRGVVRIGFRY